MTATVPHTLPRRVYVLEALPDATARHFVQNGFSSLTSTVPDDEDEAPMVTTAPRPSPAPATKSNASATAPKLPSQMNRLSDVIRKALRAKTGFAPRRGDVQREALLAYAKSLGVAIPAGTVRGFLDEDGDAVDE